MTRPTLKGQVAFASQPGAAAQVYSDVSSLLRAVNTKRGRQQELDRDEAGSAGLTANNRQRHLDPTYTAGPYYPNVKPMRRLRLGANQNGETRLSLPEVTPGPAYARGVGSDPLGASDDLDARIWLAVDDWTSGGQQARPLIWKAYTDTAWALSLAADGSLILDWRPDIAMAALRATSTAAVPLTDGVAGWCRATLDVDDGGSHTVTFYTSTDGSTWSQLGSAITSGGTTTVDDAPGYIFVGGGGITTDQLVAEVYGAEVLQGIDGTRLAAPYWDGSSWWDPDFPGYDAAGCFWQGFDGAVFYAPIYIWSGYVLRWPQKWPRKRNAVVELAAADGFHPLNLKKLTGTYSAVRSDVRVEDILDDVGIPAEDRALSIGQSTIIASELENTPALEHLQHVALSENGRLFMDAAGKVVFRGRHTELQAPYNESRATFGEGAGEYPYISCEASYGEDLIINEARVSRAGGDEQVATDPDSAADYFSRTLERANLLISTDTEASDAAAWLVARYKDPQLRIERLEIEPEKATDPAALWALMLDLELGDRITVKRRPPGGGDPISQECRIEGISHEIRPKWWRIYLDLSPADISDYCILDDATAAVIGSTTRLAY